MTPYRHPYPITAYRPVGQDSPRTYVDMGRLGAVVGLCGAGAANLWRLQRDEISRTTAVVDTLRVGVASGLATAAASLVAGQFRSPTLSLLATLATGTAVMYALNAEHTAEENTNER